MRRFGVVLVAALLLSGCATPMKMAVTKESKEMDLQKNSILLMTADLSNVYRPDYQPVARVVYVEKENAQDSSERLNFLADEQGTVITPTGNKYAFRMGLAPGKYVVRGIGGGNELSPFVAGHFFVPMHSNIEVRPGTVAYVGDVKAVIRERQGEEMRAGAVLPLVDQAVTGFAGGIDVEIKDNADADIKMFQSEFPLLQTAKIEKQVLPPFDRQFAQKWWEQH